MKTQGIGSESLRTMHENEERWMKQQAYSEFPDIKKGESFTGTEPMSPVSMTMLALQEASELCRNINTIHECLLGMRPVNPATSGAKEPEGSLNRLQDVSSTVRRQIAEASADLSAIMRALA